MSLKYYYNAVTFKIIPCNHIFPFTALQTLIPKNTCKVQNQIALSGDRVVLHCPIQPGALLQSYSVVWKKDDAEIAKFEPSSPQNVTTLDSKYDIDKATYALIIDPVSVNDSSTGYKCQLSAENPITDTKQELHYYPQPTDVSLSLKVLSTCKFNPIANSLIN